MILRTVIMMVESKRKEKIKLHVNYASWYLLSFNLLSLPLFSSRFWLLLFPRVKKNSGS
jgi:hypothetical protein